MTEDDHDPRHVLLRYIEEKGTCSTQDVIDFVLDQRLNFGARLYDVLKQEEMNGKIEMDVRQGMVRFVP